jgi:hypothetical protein
VRRKRGEVLANEVTRDGSVIGRIVLNECDLLSIRTPALVIVWLPDHYILMVFLIIQCCARY